ncbi:MAG: chromophore lyase CpcT/CpeT [Oceanicaulis sp.]
MLSALIAAAALQAADPSAPAPPRAVQDADFAMFLDWFEGRFDNDRQVFFAEELGVPEDVRHERIHSIFRPVDLPAFGAHVFYVEQYSNADPANIYRQRIYVFEPVYETGEIRLDIHAPADPDRIAGAHLDPSKLEGLTPEAATAYPQCAVYWRRQENQFVGETRRGECRVESRRSGRTLVIEDDLVLTDGAIWIRDRAETDEGDYVYGNRAGIPHKLRRARPFSCWVAVLRGAEHGDSGEGAPPSAWDFRRDVFIHDQGGRAQITTDEDPPRLVELRLRDVDWPDASRRASLTLYVHEAGSNRAASYAWTEGGADRIGINLRWLQASCTHTPNLWGEGANTAAPG